MTTQLGPFLVLIGVAALALAALGGVVAWYNDESRRIQRSLRHVLKGDTHALVVAQGRGRGAGFNFTSNTMAVTWDCGAWCLVYRIDELLGVELIVDGQVAARAFRGEPRRPLDVLGGADRQVSLRLVFDDPQHADFGLELWSAARAGRRGEPDAADAVEEGNRWLARVESIFRRKSPLTRAAQPARQEPESARPRPPAPAATIPADGHQELPFARDDAAAERQAGAGADDEADDEALT